MKIELPSIFELNQVNNVTGDEFDFTSAVDIQNLCKEFLKKEMPEADPVSFSAGIEFGMVLLSRRINDSKQNQH